MEKVDNKLWLDMNLVSAIGGQGPEAALQELENEIEQCCLQQVHALSGTTARGMK